MKGNGIVDAALATIGVRPKYLLAMMDTAISEKTDRSLMYWEIFDLLRASRWCYILDSARIHRIIEGVC